VADHRSPEGLVVPTFGVTRSLAAADEPDLLRRGVALLTGESWVLQMRLLGGPF
jgi:hypothetical protein